MKPRQGHHGLLLVAVCGLGVVAVAAGSIAGASVIHPTHDSVAPSSGPIGEAVADVVHNPPLLYSPGEQVPFSFDLVCPGRACGEAEGVLTYSGEGGKVGQVEARSESGHFVFSLPHDLTFGAELTYSARFTLQSGGSVRYPSEGGTMAAESIKNASKVDLGTAAFSADQQQAGTLVVSGQWGSGDGQFGINAQLSGPSSFDVDPTTGDLVVLDQVNGRVVRVSPDGNWTSDPISLKQGVPDLAVSPTGNLDVLYANAVAGASVEEFGPNGGDPLQQIPMASPAGNAIRRVGSDVVVEGDDSYWLTISANGKPLTTEQQITSATAGISLNGHLVLRKNMREQGNEVRLADNGPDGVRAWTITGTTTLGPVLVAAPIDNARVVEVQAQFDNEHSQYSVLTLGEAETKSFAVGQSLYAGLYDPSEFRLDGTSLYQVRSTKTGYTVYRYDL